MRLTIRMSLCLLAPPLIAAPAVAQPGTSEVGFDAGGDVTFVGGQEDVDFSVPTGRIRWGVFFDDANSIEIEVGGAATDVADDADFVGTAGLGVIHHLSSDYRYSRPFMGLRGRYSHIDVGDVSAGQFGVGGILGYVLPVSEGAIRLAVAYTHSIGNDDFAEAHTVSGTIGASVFIGRPRARR